MVHPNDELRPHINSSLFITSWKVKGCNLQQYATLPLLALTVSLTQSQRFLQCYNTIQYTHSDITMLFFYRGNTMENSTVNQYHGPQNYWPTNIQKKFSKAPPPNPKRGNECTIQLWYKHDWIISLIWNIKLHNQQGMAKSLNHWWIIDKTFYYYNGFYRASTHSVYEFSLSYKCNWRYLLTMICTSWISNHFSLTGNYLVTFIIPYFSPYIIPISSESRHKMNPRRLKTVIP